MFLASTAFADDATTAAAATPVPPALSGVFPLVFMFAALYFLIIRPNQKKVREHQNMVKSLRRGDKIVTAGGVIGVISKVEDDETLQVEIADNVKIRVLRETVSSVVTKTVANDNATDNQAEKNKSASK